MATHVIEIDPFNPISVERARIAEERYIAEFNEKVDRFIAALAIVGANAARAAYGGEAVSVVVEPIENGMAIKASGRAVVFLEFGAGSTVNEANRYASVMPFEVRRGSWSDQAVGPDGKTPGMYARTGYKYWVLNNGVVLTHIEPRNGMQKAYDEIIQNVVEIAREVFG